MCIKQLKKKKVLNFFNLKFKARKKNLLLLNNINKATPPKATKIVTIRITPNNTIITLTTAEGSVIKTFTAGKLKLHSSKKNYKQIQNFVLNHFFLYLKNKNIESGLHFKLLVPKFLRRKLIKRIKVFILNSNCIEIVRSIAFNGCRPKKTRRKKRKGLRLYKPHI